MNFSVYFDKGRNRSKNEDNYLIKNDDSHFTIAAVADGMGGHQAGDMASKIVINCLENYKFNSEADLQSAIREFIKSSNNKILKKGKNNSDLNGMGTTFSMGLIYEKELYIGHVGDSRIYLYRNSNLQKLTTDHTLVNKLLENNKIQPEEAFNHPQRNILTQALGTGKNLNIETKSINLKNNDLVLLCTDGLTDMICEKNIKNIISHSNFDADVITHNLGSKAIENGGKDNLTIITGIIN